MSIKAKIITDTEQAIGSLFLPNVGGFGDIKVWTHQGERLVARVQYPGDYFTDCCGFETVVNLPRTGDVVQFALKPGQLVVIPLVSADPTAVMTTAALSLSVRRT